MNAERISLRGGGRGFVQRLRSSTSADQLLSGRYESQRSLPLDERAMASIKGVSTSPVYLPGLFRGEPGRDLTVEFVGCDQVRNEDLRRAACELVDGIERYSAVPWLSLESTADRQAKRLSTMHPCYRDTLVGAVCLEVDVALKAVCGTAHGGLYCNISDRGKVLKDVCEAFDWGPNGQRRRDDVVRKVWNSASYKTSDSLFGGGTAVKQWKLRWEAATAEITATGADVTARLDRIDLHKDDRYARVRTSWTVDIHHEEVGPNGNAKEVAMDGLEICKEYLPKVPIPSGTSLPVGHMECLLQLLRAIAALTSILVTAKADGYTCMLFRDNDDDDETYYETPRWIPFEPAVDARSGAVFLGGGVAVGAVKPLAVKRHEGSPLRGSKSGPTLRLQFVKVKEHSAPSRPLLRRRHVVSEIDTCLFLHEVVCLGLGSHYSNIHHDVPLPPFPSVQSSYPTAAALTNLLRDIFPEGYSRRHRMCCSRIALDVLRRQDVERYFVDEFSKVACKEKRNSSEQHHEQLELMNGDVYDGNWLFGKMHGEGTYTFSSGARYQGRWDAGKMVGIGFFTTQGGERHLVDHRREQK